MDLKSLLKTIKLNESTISMILGAIVIVVVGVMAVNLFGKKDEGVSIPPVETEDEINLPLVYKVNQGEDLWKISEKFYGSGYNWSDIAKANNLTNPNKITEGQELTIPDVKAKVPEKTSPSPMPTKTAVRITPTPSLTNQEPIQAATYTVERGDTLWSISLRAYGDGYRWVDIAKVNKLVNPDLIHKGNVFVLPR